MTTTAYPALTEAEQLFYSLCWQPMITAGENWLEIQAPFLELPVIKQLDEGTIQILTDGIYSWLCQVVDIEAIKLVNSARQSAYDSASLQLKVVAAESGVNSDAYQTALAAAIKAQSSWTNISGAV